MKLYRKERLTLDLIVQYVEKRKFSPTVRELQQMLGHKSVSTTHEILIRLKRKRYITWEPNYPRTIQVLKTAS